MQFLFANGQPLGVFTTVLGRAKQVTHPAQTALITIRLQGLLNNDRVIDVPAIAV